MGTNTWRTRRGLTLTTLGAALALGGCGVGGGVVSTETTPARTTESATAASTPSTGSTQDAASPTGSPSGPAGTGATPDGEAGTQAGSPAYGTSGVVPGYAPGEFPAVPLFELPDLSMLDRSLAGFAIKVDKAITPRPGIVVRPARCDRSGRVVSGTGAVTLYGDGSAVKTGPDGSIVNYGDGSGVYSINGRTVTVYGDGSGTYTDGSVTVTSHGDGSGTYRNGTTAITLYGDGSGTYTGPDGTITNYGDGSGSSTGHGISITNYGDGSGAYSGGGLTITNYGDGTGLVNGVATPMAKIPPVPRLGTFPRMGALRPVKACGTTITVTSSVLFDFGRDVIRPDGAASLDDVATALRELHVTSAEVSGHTDSVSGDAFNQALSQRRAAAVVAALTSRGVTAAMTAKGYGEKRPIAPNTVKGADNPAGRQLNRRVEIFIPADGMP